MFLKKNGTIGIEKIFKDIIEENFPEIKEDLNMFLKKDIKQSTMKSMNFKEKDCVGTHWKKKFPTRGSSYFRVLIFSARKQ